MLKAHATLAWIDNFMGPTFDWTTSQKIPQLMVAQNFHFGEHINGFHSPKMGNLELDIVFISQENQVTTICNFVNCFDDTMVMIKNKDIG